MVYRRLWRHWALATLLAGGCTPALKWPSPETTVARVTRQDALIQVDTTGGRLDEPLVVGDTLTLTATIRMALATSPEIQMALARVRQAYAEAHQQRLWPNPILSVIVKFPTGGGTPTIEPGIAADLLSILQKPGNVAVADHRLRAASAQAVTVALDVLAESQDRYAQAQAMDAMLPVLQTRLALTERLLEVARAQLNAGEGTRLDVTTLETQKAELGVEIAEQQLERREIRLELTRLIGQPGGAAEWSLDQWNEPAHGDADESAWIVAGLEHRPEIQAKMWELRALGAEFRLARWVIFTGTELGAEAEGITNSRAGDWEIGPALVIPLPIFDWGQAKRELIEAQQLEAAHELNDLRRTVVQEIRRAYAAYHAAIEVRRHIRQELIPLMERRRSEAESQYRAGQSDITPLILADQDLQTAQARHIAWARRVAVSASQLQRAVGGPSIAATIPTTRPASVP